MVSFMRKNSASTTFTVDITISKDWTDDGFDLCNKKTQENLKEAILEKMLGYARYEEVEVETIRAKINKR